MLDLSFDNFVELVGRGKDRSDVELCSYKDAVLVEPDVGAIGVVVGIFDEIVPLPFDDLGNDSCDEFLVCTRHGQSLLDSPP